MESGLVVLEQVVLVLVMELDLEELVQVVLGLVAKARV